MHWDFSTYVVANIQSMNGRPNPGPSLLLRFCAGARFSGYGAPGGS